jgi:signal transduction histidine kinase
MKSLSEQWQTWMDTQEDCGIAARIKASWERCAAWGLGKDFPSLQISDPERLERDRQRRAKLLPMAEPHLCYMAQLLGSKRHAVALTDEQGVLLRLYCDGKTAQHPLFFEGAIWHERAIGTNGAGTALHDKKPVVIFGPQHYYKSFHSWTCTAAPIITNQDCLLGAITVWLPDAEATPDILNLVTIAAQAIAVAYNDHNLAGVMAASLIHEANNPLTIARGFVQLMAQADLPDQYINYARIAIDAIDQAKDILLNFTAMLKTRETHQHELIYLAYSLEEARQSILPLAEKRQVHLISSSKAADIQVRATPRLLQRVWVNIYKNALEAMDMGGTIKTMASACNGFAQIIISDSGPGIDPELRTRLFEPFTSTKATGTGLGLVVSREIIQSLGGSISITCPPRGGTVVTILLPLAD